MAFPVVTSRSYADASGAPAKALRRSLRQKIKDDPTAFAPHLKLARLALEDENPALAERHIVLASRKGAPERLCLKQERLLAHRTGNLAREKTVLLKLLDTTPADTDALKQLVHVAIALDDATLALDSCERLLSAGGSAKIIGQALAGLARALPARRVQTFLEGALERFSDVWMLHLAAKQFETARRLAPSDEARQFIDQVLAVSAPVGPVLTLPDMQPDITISGPDRPNGTLLIFASLKDTYGVPAPVLDLFFAELGLTAVFLHDARRLVYLDGMPTFGEGLQPTLDHLAKRFGEAGKPLYTLGFSAGALAALWYGAALQARASLVFSPATTFDVNAHRTIDDRRARAFFRKLNRRLDAKDYALDTLFDKARPGYRVTAFCSASAPIDLGHSELLKPYPGVRVTVLEAVNQHLTFLPAAARYGLLSVLTDAFNL
ncbi:MAG: hypothetical protein AAGF20_07345 [Pseudomonadota bacterium]